MQDLKTNLLIAEVRAGKREGSVISIQTFDTVAQNDQENWEALRKELEDIGISPSVITEKRHFIIAWFQEAVAAGKLEEDAPSDGNGSDVCLGASEDLAEGSVDGIASPGQISSLIIEPTTTEPNTIGTSMPSAHRPSRQPADVLHPRPLQRKANPRLRVTYLLNKLRGRDMQFLEAAMEGDVSMIQGLLEKGVDIQAREEEKNTALHLATRNGKEAAVRLLLRKGADIEATNQKGETALHLAAGSGQERLIQMLLGEGAILLGEKADLESRTSIESTALMIAAQTGHLSVVRLLLEKGADVNSVNIHGYTALHYAAEAGVNAVVLLLLEKGADIKSKDRYGYTALTGAATDGYESTVRILLEKGADVESETNSGSTALALAARNGHESTVQLLLEKGANIEPKNTSRTSALTLAACNGQESTVRLLLEKGANINTKDAGGKTALDRAGSRSIEILLQAAAARKRISTR